MEPIATRHQTEMSGSGADLMKREKDRARAILARMEGDGEPASEPAPAPAAWTPPIESSVAEVASSAMDAASGDGLADVLALPPLPAAAEYDSGAEVVRAAAITRRLREIIEAGPPYPDATSDLGHAIGMLILRCRALGLPHPEATAAMMEEGGVVRSTSSSLRSSFLLCQLT